jgi:hypothetical protein
VTTERSSRRETAEKASNRKAMVASSQPSISQLTLRRATATRR